MFTKSIAYTDFDGNQRTENFLFNLTRAEIVEMDLSAEGGLEKYIQNLVAAEDGKRIFEIIKDLVLKSYGEKSADGKRFIKNQELRDSFSQTEAFSQLLIELATDATATANFVNGITPAQTTNNTMTLPTNN